MTLHDCPKCGDALDFLVAQDGANDVAELMDVCCPGCGWESVDAELGDAVVEP